MNKIRSSLSNSLRRPFVQWTLAVCIVCLVSFCSALTAQDITGFWRSINDKSGQTQCIVAIYEYQNMYYGRIIGTCDASGKAVDTIYAPTGRAPGISGTPFYAGLDLIWDLRKRGSRYKGKIVDPERGRIYDAKLWVEDGNLIIRGEFLFFGRNVTWLPALESDFTPEFKKPDVTKFIPVIPEVN